MTSHEITDRDYMLSSIGNAVFSGLTMQELWTCISNTASREALDVAIEAQIKLNNLINRK